ncbi:MULTISPECIES: heavy metal translocating P-type ATPase [Psychrobacter]|uniref:heavy metal translocating P-type ATPase n=1 Tax=Psychrobacter TaxID=497 RepID=UPI0008688F9E|nr:MULTISPECIES: heavy metal translocating P-type ATPase [Psychrobacter]MBA6243830.1 heavy metal translocating P-type ATPase [Psychrobacter sp. Urea-trap-18]MBA6285413.1 heavy metal translocating P-type ATPase [Psychrobacter sp. Urea-trap-16]MBA6319067.1 heavy metal translocating P-type ATPase [Psychrobacter sp. Urea-trap-20]MBA6335086.1 heavy metal translocating P-type ATPase [Psychrobacter sp. Urea-trap-19]OEH69218.1 MAG: ATPase [Psychrobacter sp. B29-1]|tara:strand:+ start:54248 stop:57046 length:2799 start_codon:yes stop_codon:yes gene_type:complete
MSSIPSSVSSATNHSYEDTSIIEGLVLPLADHCFHCGDPVPQPPFYAEILGQSREMCCMGCQLAAQSIVEAGLEQYYLDRSEINRTASLPTQLTRLEVYDHDEIKSQFVYAQDGMSVAELSVNNLRCAACTWLIESRLDELEGIGKCQVNLTNQRMRVIWDENKLPISRILAVINEIGYEAKPYRQDTHEAMLARHNNQMLLRLGIAALGSMQAMMYAVALYFGEYSDMLIFQRDFLRWVSLFVSTPVFFYAGIPFFTSAWSAIRARQVNMDVPVSLALIITFFASLYATITGQGETYYDSVSMFIFFLLAGRYIEHNARLKAATMANDLVVVEPVLVQKIAEDKSAAEYILQLLKENEYQQDKAIENEAQKGSSVAAEVMPDFMQRMDANIYQLTSRIAQDWQQSRNQQNAQSQPEGDIESKQMVTAHSLQVGDIILVEAGSEIISDGILLSSTATVSQSLLTGEGDLIIKSQGDYIVGGAQNDSQPFEMLVTALPKDSQIGLIDRLMNRAMSEKPKLAQQADKLARWFVARILVLSVLVFVGWYIVDPSQAIWATVAVLVATCPCALSLATPIALTVSTNRLASYGFLTTRGHTLQTLAEITHVAFDKTGTLTYGKPNLLNIELITSKSQTESDGLSLTAQKDTLLAIAAALEVGSRHPIAHALLTAAYQLHLPSTQVVQHYPAGGVEAMIDGTVYRIGHKNFALDRTDNSANDIDANDDITIDLVAQRASSAVVLSYQNTDSKKWQALACFYFNDKVRDSAQSMLDTLKELGIESVMLTGDPSPQALVMAENLGMQSAYNGLSPTDKVNHIQQLQANGAVVLMVGDGINDAPVLAAADVSTSIAGAADLAQVSSDSIILNGQIEAITAAKRISDKTERIIKQNFRWALAYNSIVLIPAALGYVPPWLAAIGMSLSSLFVVLNALRLKRA